MSVGWDTLASWSVQVTVTGLSATKMPLWLVLPAKLALAMVWGIVILYALLRKLPDATALIVGPVALMTVLYAFDQQWRFYETIGLFVAAPACGAAIASDQDSATAGRDRVYSRLALFLLVSLGLTLPRFAAALEHFGGQTTPALSRFSLAETDRLCLDRGTHRRNHRCRRIPALQLLPRRRAWTTRNSLSGVRARVEDIHGLSSVASATI